MDLLIFRPALESLESRELPAADFTTAPILPTITPDMRDALRGVLAHGAALGNRANVFLKVGDSISAHPHYLTAFASPASNFVLASTGPGLVETAAFFRTGVVAGQNSFKYTGPTARGGMTIAEEVGLLPTGIALSRPGFALVMIGTNDIGLRNPLLYGVMIEQITQMCLSQGVVPVLSTLPPATGPFAGFDPTIRLYNQAVAEVAERNRVPLWNEWALANMLPNAGKSPDGIHPNDQGYLVRSVGAVQVLDKLLGVLLQGEPADPAPAVTTEPWRPIAAGQAVVAASGGADSADVVLFDSASGERLTKFAAYPMTLPGGVHVAAADVTGDGVLDIITAPGFGGGPHVKVFDGTSGAEVAGFLAYDPAFLGGVWVTAADVTGDGRAEIVTGAGQGGGAVVTVFDGVTLQPIRGFLAYPAGFLGGVRVAAGDLDGDGFAEIVTAPERGTPHVKVFAGFDGQERDSLFPFGLGLSGGASVAVGDANGDGVLDLIVGAGPGGGPMVMAFDGRTRANLAAVFAFSPAFPGGVNVVIDRGGLWVGAGPGGNGQVRRLTLATLEPTGFDLQGPAGTGDVFVGAG